jgi:hypothetical protein
MIVNSLGKQVINIFMDDSGVFVAGQSHQYFIYAGYVFIDQIEKDNARRQYRTLSDNIKKSIGHNGELKAQHLRGTKHKRSLVTVLTKYESLACVVDINNIKESITNNKLSIHRYKDYAIKIAIKRKLQTLIGAGRIDSTLETVLNIFIDEQHTSTDGFYNLKESIREEFVNGIHNLDYGVFHPPLFTNGATISVQFCDSSNNYLIQASDFLANRMYTSFNYSLPKLRQLPKLNVILLP